MNCRGHREELLVERLRPRLPLTAHARPPLLAFLRKQFAGARISPRLTVTNVFDAGESWGVMCRFELSEPATSDKLFVAPITQLAFDRRRLDPIEVAIRNGHAAGRTRSH